MQPELKVRKILGRTYLNENRLAETLDIFSKILVDYPEDLETLLILGNFYLASGDGRTAKTLFLRAKVVEPGNKSVERQIAMAEEIQETGFEETSPTDLQAVARLLQRLTGQPKAINENELLRAALLLEKIVHSDSPADLVAKHLDEIDELLPALIELNIRQAHADGLPHLADALRNLQTNIDYQLDLKESGKVVKNPRSDSALLRFEGNILLLLPDMENKSNRFSLLSAALQASGCHVIEKDAYVPGRDLKPDVVIASNPHINPALIESLVALSSAGVPVVVDLDTDFEKQPVSHQDYSIKGLGVQARGKAYNSALLLAKSVTVTSESQAVSLQNVAAQVHVIPDGWSNQNPFWEKQAGSRNMINLGWVGTSGQMEDLVFIRRYIIRIIREFPQTRIVIIGNPQAYRLFESLPEDRRMYYPLSAYQEYPYLLSQLDILMVPLRNVPYNLTLPDSILVEAGARGIPWVASAIPAFRNWTAGGIISETLDEWHLNLRYLVMDGDLRQGLGQAGKRAANTREMTQMSRLWLEMLFQTTGNRNLSGRMSEKDKRLSLDTE